jgi:serine/threonine-protein kinase
MSPPQKIAHYSIVSKLGEGGMGAVYRATDTKLNRSVAIKVLPEAFAEDASRMQRFEREAQVLASLNHPNIAAIYGIEQHAIVMELVEGPDLEGPLPIATAIDYARQIAAGLEAAHEKGIVHRDLKPANIKITSAGVVKLLDFGLAKATESTAGAAASPTMSPTLPLAVTQAGMILGTAAYMSPEQARGAVVDKRADIWAFGVVLLEMLTGTVPFRGETVSDTLANVLRAPIDWKLLPPDTPPAIRRLLERCLDRDTKQRLRDIGEARIALSEPEALRPAPAVPSPGTGRRSPIWAFAALTVALAGVAGGLWMMTLARHSPSAGVTRLSISLPAGLVLTGGPPAISRDGRFLAYAAQGSDGIARLYTRALDRYESTEIPQSEGAMTPFFSPDSSRVGFFARRKLMTASREGGTPAIIADANYIPIGGAWGENDFIYYAPSLTGGIMRIPASGGKPEKLTDPDEAAKGYAHVWPQYLFDSHQVLFSIWGGENMKASGTVLLSPQKGTWTRVSSRVRSASYALSGYLLALAAHGIMAAPLDAAHPHEVYPNTYVLDDVFSSPSLNALWFAVSDTGTLVYAPGDPDWNTLAWVDRKGGATSITDKPESIADPALSPDGAHLVLAEDTDLWMRDLRHGTRTRLTFENEGGNQIPSWSRDGARIIFASNRAGEWDIFSVPSSGGPAKRVLARKGTQFPQSEAPGGTLLFAERTKEMGNGSDIMSLKPDGSVIPVVVSPASKVHAQSSPDGRMVAYVSDETGRNEVYVHSLVDPAETVAVSSDGGTEPLWSPDGGELFYRRGDAFLAAAVKLGKTLAVGGAQKLFEIRAAHGRYTNHAGYAVSPDGKRFLILRPAPRAIPTQINIVLNWFDELKAKAPRS